ncbi:MAG: hypothetical protein ABR502_04280 [Chitinophagaceae bacterium]
MSQIKIKFEANQQHQIKAVEMCQTYFKEMPKLEAAFRWSNDTYIVKADTV